MHDVGRELAERRDADAKTDDAWPSESPPRWRWRERRRRPPQSQAHNGEPETARLARVKECRRTRALPRSPTRSNRPPECTRTQAGPSRRDSGTIGPRRDRRRRTRRRQPRPRTGGKGRSRADCRQATGPEPEAPTEDRQQRSARRNAADSGRRKSKCSWVIGLPWNWSIQKSHFKDFTPILDFIDALSTCSSPPRLSAGPNEDARDIPGLDARSLARRDDAGLEERASGRRSWASLPTGRAGPRSACRSLPQRPTTSRTTKIG